MCLPDFIRFEQIKEEDAVIGYRNWANPINSKELKSTNQNYIWKNPDGPHEVLDINSGLYSYNNYNNHYYNNYNYYNYYNNNYNNYNYYNNNYYNLAGIIKQWGKIAIHKNGYRSEYARIITLFNIRKLDAKGPNNFLNWIDKFNTHIEEVAKHYNVENIISWQDFVESNKKEIKK